MVWSFSTHRIWRFRSIIAKLRRFPVVGSGFERLPTRPVLQLKQELLEHRRRIGDQENMSSLRNAGLVRQWLTGFFTIRAGFLLSNHCAFGVVRGRLEPGVKAAGCRLLRSRAKRLPAPKTTCCKV